MLGDIFKGSTFIILDILVRNFISKNIPEKCFIGKNNGTPDEQKRFSAKLTDIR